jgi:hypothetical protein
MLTAPTIKIEVTGLDQCIRGVSSMGILRPIASDECPSQRRPTFMMARRAGPSSQALPGSDADGTMPSNSP